MDEDAVTAQDPLAPVRARIEALTSAWASGMTLAEIRASFDAFTREAGPRSAAAARLQPAPECPVPAAWIGSGRPRVLYCHGGGFQIGGLDSHAGLMARIAEAAQARLLAVDYRLAPEHRWPAAEDDLFAAYSWMVAAGGPPDAIAGDSAGGALALRLAIRARDAGLGLPEGLVLISPWLDLSLRGASYVDLAQSDIFSKTEQLRLMARTYLGRGTDPADPSVSPVHGDLSGLPPILVHAGACDITLDDSRLLERRAAERGTAVTLRVFDGMCHHFQVFEDLPESVESLAGIGVFLRSAAGGML